MSHSIRYLLHMYCCHSCHSNALHVSVSEQRSKTRGYIPALSLSPTRLKQVKLDCVLKAFCHGEEKLAVMQPPLIKDVQRNV